ncbi:MAG TPA: hypothetical protein VMV89_05895, partial [Candidatus Paceibacterota bacterium]|nr:hypothetical protein [Candidatus Paceibacterota bacterium]
AYYYVVSAVNADGESANSGEATVSFPKLTGAIIGTPGSWNNSGNTITNVFDNNLGTFFDGPTGNGCWVGLDFGVGVSNVITQVNYCPRSGFESRMVDGIFQGANQSDFSDAVTFYTVAAQPPSGTFTSVSVTNTSAFRYVRYLSPNGGYGNVAELQFYGCQLSIPSPPPLVLSLAGANLTFSWPLVSGFSLQSTKDLTSGNWLTVTSTAPQIVGGQWQMSLPLPGDAGSTFYRLSQ